MQAHDVWLQTGEVSIPDLVHRAYRRWAVTQGACAWSSNMEPRGELIDIPALHSQRAPGTTCLPAAASGLMGTLAQPLNTSKGCGGIMRTAPVGLTSVSDPFLTGCELAAITHGNPSAYLPAGFLAMLIAQLVDGVGLDVAVDRCRSRLSKEPGNQETLAVVDRAITEARRGRATPETIERLGEGWTGHEALAISLFCALVAKDFAHGVLLAVNHSGDSDSTGSITGNILGLLHGEAIPRRWLDQLELRYVIEDLAGALWNHFGKPPAQFA